MLKTKKTGNLVIIGLVAGLFLFSGYCVAQGFPDFSAPVVRYVSPAPDSTQLPSDTQILAYLYDPEIRPGHAGSGVNIEKIQLFINGEPTEYRTMIEDNGLVTVLTEPQVQLPESSWIEAELLASDNAGNFMRAFIWRFLTASGPDKNPPAISNLSPPDGCVHVSTNAQISCKIFDEESGVDIKSVVMKIDGQDVAFESEEIPGGVFVYFWEENPMPYDSWINVFLAVRDYAGNYSDISWTFQTESEPIDPPTLIFPENNMLLNYQIEESSISYQWSYDVDHKFYRIVILLPESAGLEKIDLGPADYELIDQETVLFEYVLSEMVWKQISGLGFVEWFVVKIDGYNGMPICGKPESCFFQLAPPNVVVLRSPSNNSCHYRFNEPPVFSWDPFWDADSYTLGLAKIGIGGDIVGEVIMRSIEGTVTSFSFGDSGWAQLEDGEYIWAVIAHLQDGTQSGIMNYYFKKFQFPPLQFTIN